MDCTYTLPAEYFLTVCAKDKVCLFADVEGTRLVPTAVGECVVSAWEEQVANDPDATCHAFVLMPNHVHALVDMRPPPDRERVRDFRGWVGQFKGRATGLARRRTGQPDLVLWQRSFFERIVRHEGEHMEYQDYIEQNPARWIRRWRRPK